MYEDILKVKLPFLFLLQVFVRKKHQLQDIHVCLAFSTAPDGLNEHLSKSLQRGLVEYELPLLPVKVRALAYGRERLENIRGKCDELRKYLDSSFGLENILGEGRTAENAPRAR